MRPRLFSVVVSGAAFALLCFAVASPSAASAPAESGLTYSWVGSSGDGQGDGHSWTDRRNWSPQGVPGDGDAVNIVSPQSGPCNIHVDHVPTGVQLSNLLLSTSITPGCKASISGGSISIHGGFLWTGGTIDTPITLAPGTGGQLGDEPVHVVERLLQPMLVKDASLHLNQAHMRLLKRGSIRADQDSFVQVGISSQITGPACCDGLPRFVHAGKMVLSGSTLALDSIAFVQRGEVDLDAGSTLVTTHGSLSSRLGARYVGPGRLTMSNGTSAIFTRQQVLSGGVHLELGNDGSQSSTLSGVAQLSGDGVLDWTGGTIDALLVFDPGVMLHAYGASDGPGRRILNGDFRHGLPQHYVVSSGPVVVDDGAGFTMTENATLAVNPPGSLTLAPGTRIVGTSSGSGDAIESGTTVSVPADKTDAGPVVLEDVAYVLEGGGTDIAPDSELVATGNTRGSLGQTGLSGGGTLSVGEPMDVVSLFSFEDASLMRLLPGGSLDASAVYTGVGSFAWLGGRLSGNDVSFAINDLRVGGRGTKSIGTEGGFTSFVQVVNPVTFMPGTKTQPNVLDMNGNDFETFVACTLNRNVELKDGVFASSQGALVVKAAHGRVVTDRDLQLFSSGPMSLFSGRLVSRGAFFQTDGDTEIRSTATLRLPVPSHPLMLQGGSLTGEGTVHGDIVNTAGIFDPLVSGSEQPLMVHGSYTQSAGGRLVLDVGAHSAPLGFDGAVAVAGIVTYNNLAGYSPGFGDQRTLLTAGSTMGWSPDCEETTGTRSDRGHWVGSADGTGLRATFARHPGGTC